MFWPQMKLGTLFWLLTTLGMLVLGVKHAVLAADEAGGVVLAADEAGDVVLAADEAGDAALTAVEAGDAGLTAYDTVL